MSPLVSSRVMDSIASGIFASTEVMISDSFSSSLYPPKKPLNLAY